MTDKQDTGETATAADGGGLDPREAAALLEQTRRRAQRQLDIRPPLLMLVAAVVALIAYGALWLSVRDQHPYDGPTATALVVLYGTLVAWIVLYSVVYRRATSGVGGRAARQRRAEAAVFLPIWISVYVFQGALHHAGASHAIAYGIYPAAAPLIIVGGAAAAHSAAKANWEWAGFAVAAVVLGAGAAFAGPATVWAIVGVGLATLLGVRAAATFWFHRA
jgi:hypothetical protein